MANTQAKKDNNSAASLIGISSSDGVSTVPVAVDPITGRMLVDLAGGGTLTTISIATANGFSGTVANPTTTPAITIIAGAITPTTVNGLTVGLGGGSNGGNTAIGVSALQGANYGSGYNTAVGVQTLYTNTGGGINTAVGARSLFTNLTGYNNTAIGGYALYNNSTGSGNIGLGFYAGAYETSDNAFYVDNQNRTNTAGDKAGALLYGTFNATPASQTLTINAAVNALVSYAVAGTKVVGAQVASIGLNAKSDTDKITDIIVALRAHGLLGANA